MLSEGQDPAFRFHDDSLFRCRVWAVGSSSLDRNNGGSVEMLLLSSGRMHFN